MTIKVTYNVTDVYMSQSVSPVYINVSYSDGGASGGGVWGSITGTLSNQTDLQTALDSKVPYSGATGNVNLGEYELKAGQVTLDTSPTGTAAVGTIRWNDTTGTSETTLKGGNVIIKNGVDLVARVVNKVSPNTTLTKAAYQAVRISGAQGQRLAVALAQANNDANSADTIGLVTETIATNQEGFIMTMGQLENINTTGALQGETWVDGDVLYLSPTTAGAITNVKPTGATGHLVIIGYVEYAHANNGKIYVKVMNGWELDELHNVSIVSPANNQGLFYNSSNSLWENKTISTALGYTPVPTTRNITINGVTYDLSADRTWTIAAGISGSGASGQVTYWTGSSAVSGSTGLVYNDSTGVMTLSKNQNAATLLTISNTTANSSSQSGIVFNTNSGITGGIGKYSSSTTAFKIIASSDLYFYNGNGGDISLLNDVPTGRIKFTAGAVSTSQMTLFANGNLAINSGVSDLGVRFGVIGDTLLRGSGNTSATTALTVQNSDSTNMWRFLNNGDLLVGTTSEVTLRPNNGTITSPQLSGRGLTINIAHISGTGSGVIINNVNGDRTATSGVSNTLLVQNGFAPTSGTGQFSMIVAQGTINQTGGANGITRGLYVNPTLTAAADWRSIEWSNNSGWGLYGAGTANNYLAGSLGIGTPSPLVRLHIYGTEELIRLDAFSGGNNAYINFNARGFIGYNASSGLDIITGSTRPIRIGHGSWGSVTPYITIFQTTGNVGINTTSDLAVRFGVLGDTLLRGSGATSATTALTVQNSSSTNLFSVRNDGAVAIGTTLSAWSGSTTPLQISGGALWNFGSTNIYLGLNYYFNGSSRIYIQSAAASEYRQSSGEHYWYSAISGTAGGTVSFTETMRLNINGYLGIGINAPTALTDIGASTTTRASLRIRSGTAPTTPNDGDIWFDGTDIKMRIGGVTKTFTLI